MSIKQVMVVGMLSLVAGVASAQSAAPAEVIKARQQGFKDLGAAFKTIREQAQSGAPDMEKVKAAAPVLKKTAEVIGTWFPAGTGPDSGIKTTAKAEIWSDAAGFSAAAKAFAEQVTKFQQVVAGGDAAALPDAVKAVGKTCGGCHDNFRTKDH